MLSTVVAVFAVVGLVLPGFVVAELSRAERAQSGSQSDFELILRALFYALLIHLLFSPWTAWLVRTIHGGEDWTHHLAALVPYGVALLIVTPAALGTGLNAWLRRAERAGTLNRLHALAGARDARDAFDFVFGQLEREGRYVLVRRRDSEHLLAGTFGPDSWAGKAPEPHDLYLEELRSVSADGAVGPPLEPRHGVWIACDAIAEVFVVEPPA
jgi:hypothetical protein